MSLPGLAPAQSVVTPRLNSETRTIHSLAGIDARQFTSVILSTASTHMRYTRRTPASTVVSSQSTAAN